MKNLTKAELVKLIPKIELVRVNEIVLNPDNPRIISQRKFEELVTSVTSFYQMLFLRPIVLDDNNMALGGNMRTLAGKKAGFEFLPCMRAKNLSDQQRREFIIKDNIPFGEWNFDQLANDWDAELLAGWGLDFPGSREVSFTATDKPKTYNILLKCTSEEERGELIGSLEAMNMVKERDFFII